MIDNWIDFNCKKPQEVEGKYLVFDGERILMAEWNNHCVCEMSDSPQDRGLKKCGNRYWKFMVFEDGSYDEIDISHWIPLPNKPFNLKS